MKTNKDLSKLSGLFKLYNQKENKIQSVVLSEGQKSIFNTIVNRYPKRNHVISYTQMGKSEVVSMAVLLRVVTHPEKWAIVAPSQPKAMIIMKNIIGHCFDNEMFREQLNLDEEKKSRLKREVSKTRLTFKNGGEVFVLSADNRNKASAGESLMGFGAANIVIDESSLIDDEIYSKIKRMLGGHSDNFLFEIGNPFHRNHFYDSSLDDNYNKIFIDYKQGIREGRITAEFIEEMRRLPNFGVMYECKFPDADTVDEDGWMSILTESDITNSFRDEEIEFYAKPRLGVDIARSGGNFNVWVLRSGGFAKVVGKTTTDNLMEVVGLTREIAEKYKVDDNNVFVDATGMGAGVYDRFLELNFDVNGINLGSSAQEDERYINIRAEAYFRLMKWMKEGGMLLKNNDFYQLRHIRYKTRSNGKIKIIDKETLNKRGIASPDVADALMLTFSEQEENSSFMRMNNISLKRVMQPKYD